MLLPVNVLNTFHKCPPKWCVLFPSSPSLLFHAVCCCVKKQTPWPQTTTEKGRGLSLSLLAGVLTWPMWSNGMWPFRKYHSTVTLLLYWWNTTKQMTLCSDLKKAQLTQNTNMPGFLLALLVTNWTRSLSAYVCYYKGCSGFVPAQHLCLSNRIKSTCLPVSERAQYCVSFCPSSLLAGC